MDDTAKIVLGAVVGFVSAVAAEPLKQSLIEFRKRRRIRRAIKHAASILWWELTDIIERHPGEHQLGMFASMDEIRHYIAHETTTFWSVRGAWEMKILLDKRDQIPPGDKRAAAEALVAFTAFTSRNWLLLFGWDVRCDQKRDKPSISPKMCRLMGWKDDSTLGA